MLCSVIIPTIGRSTLTRAVESILSQPVTDFELIVVNDSGAPLASAAWADDSRVRVLNTNRSGVCFACNAGAAVARGKYVKILHDDDYLLEAGLRVLIEAAEKANAAWVIGSARIVDARGETVYNLDSGPVSGNILAELAAGASIHVSYCLVLRRTFLDVGGLDPRMKIGEDRDFFSRVALTHDVVSTRQAVACVQVSGSPTSAFDFGQVAQYSRAIRERILDSKQAYARVRDSVHSRVWLRGRVCRQGIYSAALNLRNGNVWMALARLSWSIRLASFHFVRPQFWRGMFST